MAADLTSEPSRPPTIPGASWLPEPWVWLLIALVGEYWVLAISFDVAPWLDAVGLRAQLGFVRTLGPSFLVGSAAILVAGGAALRKDLSQLLRSRRARPRRWGFVALHAAGFAALYGLSAFLFLAPYPGGAPWSWFGAWVLLGTLTVALLVASFVPLHAWLTLLWTHRRALLLGGGVALAAWEAGKLSAGLWDQLGPGTLRILAAASGLLIDSVVVDPERWLLGTDRFVVRVMPECSGYEGIGLILVFLGGYLALAKQTLRFPRALLLLPVGVAAMWCANVLRIVGLVVFGHWVSPEIAISGFHANIGWILFSLVALSIVYGASRSAWLSAAEPVQGTAPEIRGPTLETAYLLPMLAVLATSLLTGLFSTGIDLLYGLRVLAAGIALYVVRDGLPKPGWRFAWLPLGLGLLIFVIWLGFAPEPDAHSELGPALAGMSPPWRYAWIATRLLGSICVAPVVEELAFRGYLLRRLQSAHLADVDPRRLHWPAYGISSLAFGLLHSMPVAGTVAGFLFALAQRQRGRIGDAIVAHAVANLLLSVTVLGWGWWSLW